MASTRARPRHLQAVAAVLAAPREIVHGQILNVGDPEANYQIREIADLVGRVFPDCEVTVGDRGADKRSYKVSFASIHDVLPGLRFEWTVERGARSYSTSSGRRSDRGDFNSRNFTRLNQIDHLLRRSRSTKGSSGRQPHDASRTARARAGRRGRRSHRRSGCGHAEASRQDRRSRGCPEHGLARRGGRRPARLPAGPRRPGRRSEGAALRTPVAGRARGA